MRILDPEEVALLELAAQQEVTLINMGFKNVSEASGLLFLRNAITMFEKEIIKKRYGLVINSMCTEYRVFLVELLKGIDEEYKIVAFGEVLRPKIKDIEDEELLEIIDKAKIVNYGK